MSFDAPPRPSRPARRWQVRLFETSDKLEEHLNRSDLRPDQVTSISVDNDGFFVLVYWVGPPSGGPPERRAPYRRRAFEGDEEGERPSPRPPRGRGFDREGPPRRFPGPPRRGGPRR